MPEHIIPFAALMCFLLWCANHGVPSSALWVKAPFPHGGFAGRSLQKMRSQRSLGTSMVVSCS